MKKFILPLAFLGSALFSCSNDSKEFELAAKEFCSCMSEGEFDAEDAATLNMNVGLCLLDAKVDLTNSEMADQVEKQCPEFKDGFEEFVKELE